MLIFWTGPVGVHDVLVACDYLIKILGVATFSIIIFGLDIEFESLGLQTEVHVVQCNLNYPDLVYSAPRLSRHAQLR